jgi:hypothetical protein
MKTCDTCAQADTVTLSDGTVAIYLDVTGVAVSVHWLWNGLEMVVLGPDRSFTRVAATSVADEMVGLEANAPSPSK